MMEYAPMISILEFVGKLNLATYVQLHLIAVGAPEPRHANPDQPVTQIAQDTA
jgi:hypothetical protein